MARNTKYTIEEVKEYFELNGCELLSKEYNHNKQKLDFICRCGNIGQISFFSFKTNGSRCRNCGNEKTRQKLQFSYDEIKQKFEDEGCKLLSSEYVNGKSELLFQCDCGNISYTSWNRFGRGARCKQCGIKKVADSRRTSLVEIQQMFIDAGCVLLETSYKTNRTPLRYICKCGKESKIRLDCFKRGKRCKECGIKTVKKALSGENSPSYNHDLTDEERLLGRRYPEYYEWRRQVYAKDRYSCQSCGDTQGGLVAHHLDGYHWAKDKRTDVNNGITLCTNCHTEFHGIYRRKFNTREQYDEWILNKRRQDAI